MDRAGGFRDYVALRDDPRAHDELLLAMAGEADAQRMREHEAKHAQQVGARG